MNNLKYLFFIICGFQMGSWERAQGSLDQEALINPLTSQTIRLKELKLGPQLRDLHSHGARIWVQGDAPPSGYQAFAFLKYEARYFESMEHMDIRATNFIDIEKESQTSAELLSAYNYIHMFHLNELPENTSFDVRVGYGHLPAGDDPNHMEIIWPNTPFDRISFHTPPQDQSQGSIFFGSCRWMFTLGPFKFGQKSGEKTFKAMGLRHSSNPVDGMFFIGDQVYLDALGPFNQKKSLKSIRKLYEDTWRGQETRKTMTMAPLHFIADDHDTLQNNVDLIIKQNNPQAYKNASQAYQEFQHHDGPSEIPLLRYYETTIGNGDFFILDARDEQGVEVGHIISQNQKNAFQDWIENPLRQYRPKFVVSSLPIVLQDANDGWHAYPEDRVWMVNLLLKSINTFVLSGDAHCFYYGEYEDSLGSSSSSGSVPLIRECLSSGIHAIKHDTPQDFNTIVDLTKKHGPKLIQKGLAHHYGVDLFTQVTYNTKHVIFQPINSLNQNLGSGIAIPLVPAPETE